MRDEADIADDADGGIAIGEYAFALGGEVHEIGHYFARPNLVVIPTAGDASVPTPHNAAPASTEFCPTAGDASVPTPHNAAPAPTKILAILYALLGRSARGRLQ